MIESMKIKIYYEDTDAGGVVYHANYLKYMERARTELLINIGHDPVEGHTKGNVYVVTAVDIKYKRPALLGDTIEVITELGWIKRVTMMLKQRCMRGDTLLVKADVTVALLNSKGKPIRFPHEISDAITKLEEPNTDNK